MNWAMIDSSNWLLTLRRQAITWVSADWVIVNESKWNFNQNTAFEFHENVLHVSYCLRVDGNYLQTNHGFSAKVF